MKPIIIQVNRVMPLSKLVSTRCLAIVARHKAESGARTGEHDDTAADAADDSAAHEADVG